MAMSDYLHAPAALVKEKKPTAAIGKKVGWTQN
jgi:hypothetical protein